MKQKNFIFVLVAMLSCSVLSVNVAVAAPAETDTDGNAYVAKIGDNTYETFSDAITDAKALTGNVTMEIYGEVEFVDGIELTGSYTSISFIGKAAGAKMTVNQTAGGDYLEAHGETVTFTDLILAKANPQWYPNSGHMSNYFSIQSGEITYTNCTFPNGACTSIGTATYNNCTFQNSSEYGLWVYDDALVTVIGGTIDSKKGIKVYSEDEGSVTSTLTVQNATFTENITSKPAVAVGYATSITLIGNTYNNTTAHIELDSSSDADCNGITFIAQDSEGNDIASTLEVINRQGNVETGVLMDGKIYLTVEAAAAEATTGSTITLLHNSTETVELPEGVTLDTNGNTAENVTVAGPTDVSTYNELTIALGAGKQNIILTANITIDAAITVADGTTIDLNDKTLYINVENSYYNNATIKNGNIVLGKDDVHTCDGYFLVNPGKTLVIDDVNITSAEGGIKGYAVFHLKTGANLDLTNSALNISDNEYTAGYIVYAGESSATLDVTNSSITGSKVNGVVHATTVIESSTVTLTNVIEHGINRSATTIDNSNVAISGGTGRGITAQHGDLIITGNSSVNISDMGEATIELRGDKNLTIAETATVALDAEVNNTTGGTITGSVEILVSGLKGEGTQTSPYLVNNIDELKWFRDDVNAGNTYKGVYVSLTADINLNNENWTPIGNSTNKFLGIFDGGNKKIQNLKIETQTSYAGFFGYTAGGALKNLTIENADVDARLGVGALVGCPFTSDITNITLTGKVTIDACFYVGGVAGRNAYGDLTDITVNTTSDSYVKANSTENGTDYRTYVGGVVGFLGEGNTVMKNVTSNIKVIGNIQDIGGIAGIAHYGNTFENITFTGTVEAAEGATEVGGIAAVWHNQQGETVTFTNCSVSEDAKVLVGTTDITEDCGLVGGAYNASNETPSTSGSLIVDGTETWLKIAKIGETSYKSLKEAIDAAQNNETVTLLDNVTTPDIVSITKSITIDGNGNTLTYTGQSRAITVDSSAEGVNLTVKNLTVDCTASYCQRGINYNTTGCFTLENVTVKGTPVYAINLPGSSDGATVTISKSNLTGCIALNVWGENSTITVADSHMTSIDNTDVENYSAVKLNNDGTNAAEGTIITITGGSITALDQNGEYSSAVSNATSTGSIIVSESTVVTGNITKFVAAVRYEGSSDSYGCNTLQSAINRATNDSKAKVVLTGDITLSEMATVNGAVKLDLNGHTICTDYTTANGNDAAICILYGGSLTIDDSSTEGTGAIDGSGVYAAVKMTNTGDNATNGTATLTVNAGKLIGNYYAIAGNGGRGGTEIIINGGTITATQSVWGYGIFHPQDGTVTVNGGTITAATGIELRGGSLVVNDGTIESTATELTTGTTDSGTTVSGAAIALSQHTTNHATTVTVNGGKLCGLYAFYQDRLIKNYSASTGINATIASDVTIDGTVVANEKAFEMTQNSDGSYSLKQTEVVSEYTITDGSVSEFTNDSEKLVEKITYTRTLLSDSKWNALYLPFEVSVETLLADGKEVAYFNDIHSYDDDFDGEIDRLSMEIIQLKSGTLKANYPYLIRATSDEYTALNIELTDATLYTATENKVVCSSVFNTYTLTGSYKTLSTEDIADKYVVTINGEWAIGTTDLKPFRLHLTITDIDGSPVKLDNVTKIRIFTRGEADSEGTTGVEEITGVDGESIIYDLQGNRVLNPGKGIYIVNGKKVIIR